MVLPPEHVIRWVIRQTASLQHHLGHELAERPMVLPNGKFFPDRYAADAASVARLMRRIQDHAGMTDVPIQTRVVGGPATPEAASHCASPTAKDPTAKPAHACKGDCGGKGCEGCDGTCHDREKSEPEKPVNAQHCGTGCGTGCGTPEDVMGDEPRLLDMGDSWRVQVPANELTQPLVLTTNLARAVGYIFLVETRSAAQPMPDNMDAAADLASTLLGFGALLLGGAHIYSKSCGGPRIRRITSLGCVELALATVLFAQRQGHDLRPMRKELEVTQKEAIHEAEQWLKDRPLILERFKTAPERLARGEIPMDPTADSLWGKLFGKRSGNGKGTDPEASIAELEAMLAEAPLAARSAKPKRPDPRVDELRALVDEALETTGSQIQ